MQVLIFSERFYLDALDEIDSACESALKEIDCKVKWKERFKVGIEGYFLTTFVLFSFNLMK